MGMTDRQCKEFAEKLVGDSETWAPAARRLISHGATPVVIIMRNLTGWEPVKVIPREKVKVSGFDSEFSQNPPGAGQVAVMIIDNRPGQMGWMLIHASANEDAHAYEDTATKPD